MTKRKIKVRKAPEIHPIYKNLDEAPTIPTNPKIPEAWRTRVAGISFSDYAEFKYMGGDGVHDPFIQKSMGINIPKNYSPRMTQEPVNVQWNEPAGPGVPPTIESMKPYTAKELQTIQQGFTGSFSASIIRAKSTKQDTKIIWPKYYQNPYQYQDYVYLQDIYANTIAGRIFDTIVHFGLAKGIKPKLIVRHEEKYTTPIAKQKALKEHKWMTDTLEEIDKNVSTSSIPTAFGKERPDDNRVESIGPYGTAENKDTPVYDTSLQNKWKAAMTNGLMFGRECLVPRVDPEDNTVEVTLGDDKLIKYKNIPKILLVIHPRDMGFNYVDYRTHRMLGIQLNNSNWILKPNEMMFWEWKADSPVYGSKFYGMSAAQSMMGSARTLRRVIEVDFPLIAKTRWSGMYWLVFKRKGEQTQTSDLELSRILANIELNGINATLEEDPQKDFMLHKIDLDPKIMELLEMVKQLIQYMMSQVGMPQGLLYGEADLNRDTLTKKIATWTKGGLKAYRQWFLDGVTAQWYRRMTKTLEAQSEKWKKAMKEFDIIADVEEYKLEDSLEQLAYIQQLQQVVGKMLTTKAIGDILDEEDIDSMIDPDSEAPMPQGNSFNVTENGPPGGPQKKSFGVSSK